MMPLPTELRPITREQWLQMIAPYVTTEPEPGVRRAQRRYNVEGMVAVAPINAAGSQTAVRTVSLLQLSDDGIMVRSHTDLPLDTIVGMQVYIEDHIFTVLGRVMHCTDTVGGYKIGIQLAFTDAPAAAWPATG